MHQITWPTGGSGDRLFRGSWIEHMETNAIAQSNCEAEVIVSNCSVSKDGQFQEDIRFILKTCCAYVACG